MKKIVSGSLLLYIVLVAFTSKAEFVSISGTLANTSGAPIPITLTDGDSIDVTVYTDSLGMYNIAVTTSYSNGTLNLSFQNCNAASHDTMITVFPGLPPIIYNGDYCPNIGTDTCYASYNTTYDIGANTFTLEIDSVTQENAIAYLWTFGDGTFSDLPFPSHEYLTNGLYEVCVNITEADSQTCQYCHTLGIDSTGAVVTRMDVVGFTINVVSFGSLSTKSLSNITAVDVYPNPTSGLVTLRFASNQSTQYNLVVHNTLGKEMLKQTIGTTIGRNEIPLSLDELSQGIYVVVLRNASKEVMSHLVIKK